MIYLVAIRTAPVHRLCISYSHGILAKLIRVMYRSNRSFNMPPPGIPRALDTFAVPGRREFDCAFVANWLRGKGLNKLCAVFEVFKFYNFQYWIQALNV